jgi:hypothetical protein
MSNEEFQKLVLENFAQLNKTVSNLEADMSTLKSDVITLKSDMKILKEKVNSLETGQKDNSKKLDAVYDETAGLIEFKTEVNIKLDGVKKDLSTMEIVTASNYTDIAKLKAVK